MGRPKKVKHTELKAVIDNLVTDYRENGVLPTDYLVLAKSGMKGTELDELYRKCFDANVRNDKCVQQMRRLILFRQSVCMENLVKGKDVDGWRVISEQKRWGGNS